MRYTPSDERERSFPDLLRLGPEIIQSGEEDGDKGCANAQCNEETGERTGPDLQSHSPNQPLLCRLILFDECVQRVNICQRFVDEGFDET